MQQCGDESDDDRTEELIPGGSGADGGRNREGDRRHHREIAGARHRRGQGDGDGAPADRSAEEEAIEADAAAKEAGQTNRRGRADQPHRRERRSRLSYPGCADRAKRRDPRRGRRQNRHSQNGQQEPRHSRGDRRRAGLAVPDAHRRRGEQNEQGAGRKKWRPRLRPPDDEERENVEIDRVVVRRLPQIGVGQRPRHGQDVIAMVLHRRRRDVGQIVERRVVARHSADAPEIDAAQPDALEHRHVGVVGQHLVDVIKERAGRRPRKRAGHDRQQPAIVTARLEEIAAARRAAIVDVDDRGHVAREIGVGHKGFRSQQSELLSVRDQKEDGVAKALVANRSRHLDQCGDSDAIVGSSRARADRIVMGGEDERVGARVAGHPGQHIGDRLAGAVRVADESLLDGDLEPQ